MLYYYLQYDRCIMYAFSFSFFLLNFGYRGIKRLCQFELNGIKMEYTHYDIKTGFFIA